MKDQMKTLEVIGVSKSFGSVTALKDFSCAVREGEILGLIGPNGAGKTTLVNLIMGLTSYSSGDIRFRGKSIRGFRPHQIGRLGISRTFEILPPSIKMTALENVMVGALFGRTGRKRSAGAARRKAEEKLDFLGLGPKKDAPAESLNVLERKRLEVAIALATDPTLLLLDEPMAGLNPSELVEAAAIIRNARNGGVTILVIEHVMRAIAKLSDRVIVLHQGKKITEGAPEKVLNDRQVIESYLGKRHKDVTGRG